MTPEPGGHATLRDIMALGGEIRRDVEATRREILTAVDGHKSAQEARWAAHEALHAAERTQGSNTVRWVVGTILGALLAFCALVVAAHQAGLITFSG